MGSIQACPGCGEPDGARYGQEHLCWPCLCKRHPKLLRNPPRRRETHPYTKFVTTVWDRIESITDSTVFYLGPRQIASYCPSCIEGTVRLLFMDHPEPRFIVGSEGGTCSLGCSAQDIGEAIFR